MIKLQTLQAALGVSGTEGGFRQAAEATLSAVRQHAAPMVALLAAVVGDPLVPWSAAEGCEGSAARKARSISYSTRFLMHAFERQSF
jgi:phosphatidylinositol kinase/protein kinase (PI-3  family)